MKTRKILFVCLALVLCAVFLSAGCTTKREKGEPLTFGTFSKQYYEKNPVSVAELDKTWGKPLEVQPAENGMERRVYLIESPLPGAGDAYRYFYVANGMVVSSGMSQTKGLGSKETHGRYVPQADGSAPVLPAMEKSMTYWAKNPTSEESVRKTWGKPVREMDFDGDIKQLIFEVADPTGGREPVYRYFIFMGGQVLAAGMTNTIGKETDLKGVSADNPMYNLSKLYYSENAVTVEDVEKTWGKPLVIQKTYSGLEKRVYKATTGAIGGRDVVYRYFLVKNGKVVASGVDSAITTDIGM